LVIAAVAASDIPFSPFSIFTVPGPTKFASLGVYRTVESRLEKMGFQQGQRTGRG
jgi:hypothetical protein